jgi:hypothetical protein
MVFFEHIKGVKGAVRDIGRDMVSCCDGFYDHLSS